MYDKKNKEFMVEQVFNETLLKVLFSIFFSP
jgi:hypothetical protein